MTINCYTLNSMSYIYQFLFPVASAGPIFNQSYSDTTYKIRQVIRPVLDRDGNGKAGFQGISIDMIGQYNTKLGREH